MTLIPARLLYKINPILTGILFSFRIGFLTTSLISYTQNGKSLIMKMYCFALRSVNI
jgi:hypothetical protein